MANNIFQQSVTPQKPNILRTQRVNVYVPTATKNSSGIASFEERDFNINNGHVTSMWPEQIKVEQLANPLINISYIKVTEDEFENTGKEATVINPITGIIYKSQMAEVKLKRIGRNATVRPDLIKVTAHDFNTYIDSKGEVVHTIALHNPLEEPSLIQVDIQDFKSDNQLVQINWPFAHNASGSINTNGYGLIKIAPNSEHYLKYIDGILGVDYIKLFSAESAQVRPIYSGTIANGFIDKDEYIDTNGKAKRNDDGNILIAITKESVGLSKVANRSFDSWQYEEFGESMKNNFDSKFALKLDKITWNSLFSDWVPPSNEERTPQLRFNKLVDMHNAQQEQIDTLKTIKSFLGYFEDLTALIAIYPASEKFLGFNAYLLTTGSYWSIRQNVLGEYEWYNTEIDTVNFVEYIETDSKRLRPNGEASVGSSGLWVQSDHIHPTDTTRLATELYKATNVSVYSQFTELPDDVQDFKFNMWNEDSKGIYQNDIKVNIPYIRKSQGIHNWAGSHGVFNDSEKSLQKVWLGSLEDYENEKEEIANNSIIFIADDEDFIIEDYIQSENIYKAGLLLDKSSQYEKFVITDTDLAPSLVGKCLTLNITTRKDGSKVYNLAEKLEQVYTPNKLLVSDNKGDINTSAYSLDNIILNFDDGFTQNQLIVGQTGKFVKGMSTSNIANRPIVSDGVGGVTMMPLASNDATILVANSNGSIEPASIIEPNVLVTSIEAIAKVLQANKLLVSGQYNTVTTYDTGNENTMLVSNGLGAIKQSTIGANKLLYTSAQGIPAAFPMSPVDVGKVVGVSFDGTPTLMSIIHPSTLPVTTFTDEPESINNNGTKIVMLDSEPETMYAGYLYLW